MITFISRIRKFIWNIKASAYQRVIFMRSHVRLLDSQETIRRIKDTGCSISRYGDGEFGIIFGRDSGFQNADPRLASRLAEILKSDCDNVLVCIPYSLKSMRKLSPAPAASWKNFYINNGRRLIDLLIPGKTYGDSFVSRFYMDLKDKSSCLDHYKSIKSLWDGRDIFIVEGEKSRLGVGNDIFDNVRSVHRILCPAKDAFSSYDVILAKCKELIPKDSLVLCALGMTATVLSYDLAMEGYQALDIGHIDIEYEWMRMGATEKCAVPTKAVNGINMPEGELQDNEYQESISARIV